MSSADDWSPGRREHLFRGRHMRIHDLVDASLLDPRVVFVHDWPQAGEPSNSVTVASPRARRSRIAKRNFSSFRTLTAILEHGACSSFSRAHHPASTY